MRKSKAREGGAQADIELVLVLRDIVESRAFRRGFADARAGRKPRFDEETWGGWVYEWGRQFAIVMPRDFELEIKGRLNSRAVGEFAWAKAFGGVLP